MKYAAALALLLLAGAGGLYFLTPRDKPPSAFQATDAPLRQAAAEDKQAAPAAEPAPVPAPAAPQTANNEANSQAPAAAPPVPGPEATPSRPVPGQRYRVVRGDMLSAIALEAYGDASLFRLIQRANPGVANADRIFSDQVISLPPKP